MNKEVKEIIIDLITRVWNTEKEYYLNAGERNMREAELTDIYYELEEKIGACDEATAKDYEESIEELEEELEDLEERLEKAEFDNIDLIDNNYILAQENDKLREILGKISEAVNDTWC